MKKSLVALMALICVLLLAATAMAQTDYIPSGTNAINASAGMKYIGKDTQKQTITLNFTPQEKGTYTITGTSGVEWGWSIAERGYSNIVVRDDYNNVLFSQEVINSHEIKAVVALDKGIHYRIEFYAHPHSNDASERKNLNDYTITICCDTNHAAIAEEWTTVMNATCTENGRQEKICEVCREVARTRSIPATGHDATGSFEVEKQATCLEAGAERLRCKTCNAILEENALPKLEHVIDKWTLSFAPTCTADGKEVQTCLLCGTAINSRAILAANHVPGEFKVDEYSGSQSRSCTVCGEVLEVKQLPVQPIGDIWHCASCDNHQAFGNYCFACGGIRSGLKICSACGKMMPDGYTGAFCMYCGGKLPE